MFGLGEGDKQIRTLGTALRDLLHHNTNLKGEQLLISMLLSLNTDSSLMTSFCL